MKSEQTRYWSFSLFLAWQRSASVETSRSRWKNCVLVYFNWTSTATINYFQHLLIYWLFLNHQINLSVKFSHASLFAVQTHKKIIRIWYFRGWKQHSLLKETLKWLIDCKNSWWLIDRSRNGRSSKPLLCLFSKIISQLFSLYEFWWHNGSSDERVHRFIVSASCFSVLKPVKPNQMSRDDQTWQSPSIKVPSAVRRFSSSL